MSIVKYYIYGFKVGKPKGNVDDGGAPIHEYILNQIFSGYLEPIKSDEKVANEKTEAQNAYRLYCNNDIDICFKDIIHDPDGNCYDVTSIQKFTIGRHPHQELTLERRI